MNHKNALERIKIKLMVDVLVKMEVVQFIYFGRTQTFAEARKTQSDPCPKLFITA